MKGDGNLKQKYLTLKGFNIKKLKGTWKKSKFKGTEVAISPRLDSKDCPFDCYHSIDETDWKKIGKKMRWKQ